MKTFFLFIAATASSVIAASTKTIVTPKDTGAALVNPGMGISLHHYDNGIKRYGLELEPSDTVDDFPGVSDVYLRLAWSYIEPEEGKFNWSIVDTPAQRWIAKGKRISLRFSCSESGMDQPFATPEWVRKAGAKGYFVTPRKGIDPDGKIWEPDYDDAVFLEKLDRFLAAAAARYDGDPSVSFIDIGSFGVWGEGHTFATSLLPYSAATAKRHIDLHRKHFKKTPLMVNDDFSIQGRGLEVLVYAAQQGMGLRDDSILVQPAPHAYHHAYVAPLFWPHAPVVLEMEHYGPSKQRDAWKDGSEFLKALEEYHASYATIHWYPREFLKEMSSLVDKINLRLGYRLQLLQMSWPSSVPAASAMDVGYHWRNAGVAPCLPGGFPAVTLKDAKGGTAGVFVDEDFDMRTLPVGLPDQAVPVGRDEKRLNQAFKPLKSFLLPPANILKPGTYDVFISVGNRQGTPVIALPLAGEDGQRRYKLGSTTVTGAAAVR
jgi:hypothetical protein